MSRMWHHKAPAYLVEKLCTLIEHLKAEKVKYDHFALSSADCKVSNILRGLSQENLQYINEIESQLRILGADSNERDKQCEAKPPEINPAISDQTVNGYSTEEILSICRSGEKNLIAVFRDVLNEPFLLKDTRTLLRYQLNGIMYAFLQLKLVSSTYSH